MFITAIVLLNPGLTEKGGIMKRSIFTSALVFMLLSALIISVCSCAGNGTTESSLTYKTAGTGEIAQTESTTAKPYETTKAQDTAKTPETTGAQNLETSTTAPHETTARPDETVILPDLSNCAFILQSLSTQDEIKRLPYTEGTEEYDFYKALLYLSVISSRLEYGATEAESAENYTSRLMYYCMDYYTEFYGELQSNIHSLLLGRDIGKCSQQLIKAEGNTPAISVISIYSALTKTKAAEMLTYKALCTEKEAEILNNIMSLCDKIAANTEKVAVLTEKYNTFAENEPKIKSEWDSLSGKVKITVSGLSAGYTVNGEHSFSGSGVPDYAENPVVYYINPETAIQGKALGVDMYNEYGNRKELTVPSNIDKSWFSDAQADIKSEALKGALTEAFGESFTEFNLLYVSYISVTDEEIELHIIRKNAVDKKITFSVNENAGYYAEDFKYFYSLNYLSFKGVVPGFGKTELEDMTAMKNCPNIIFE